MNEIMAEILGVDPWLVNRIFCRPHLQAGFGLAAGRPSCLWHRLRADLDTGAVHVLAVRAGSLAPVVTAKQVSPIASAGRRTRTAVPRSGTGVEQVRGYVLPPGCTTQRHHRGPEARSHPR